MQERFGEAAHHRRRRRCFAPCGRRADVDTNAHATPCALGLAPASAFVYVPAPLGRVSPNRIQNTAVSNIMLKQNVDRLTQNAVARALRTAGFDVVTGRSAKPLSGRIEALGPTTHASPAGGR